MNGEQFLVNELKRYRGICYYPSSGNDLSDIDFFGSGKRLWQERIDATGQRDSLDISSGGLEPELFIHTDINFYQEFAAGKDLQPEDCGIHGPFEVVSFRELPGLESPNSINENYDHSGKCFEYKFKTWDSDKIRTLIFCLCENEFFVAGILLKHSVTVDYIWSKNWCGSKTYGTWLVNVLDRLGTKKFYTDWLCVPGKRGEPRNLRVEEHYPELICEPKVALVRNEEIRWIDEGANGWVEEFIVERKV